MHRTSSALVLGGAVLLMSYISAPAAPTPAPARVSDAELDAVEASAPVAAIAAQEAERLRQRLAVVPERPATQRDPFTFGPGPRSSKRAVSLPVPEPVIVEVEAEPPPALVWPKLVALLTDNGKMTAVLGVGETVEILKAGESAGGFLVREITATSIEVVHIATSVVTRLPMR